MKLFVVTHKEVPAIPQGRTLIGVGKNRALTGVEVYDNTGDNIAEKNPNYCELTALYWMWKNVGNEDFVGLEHYRRFFCEKYRLKAKPLSAEKIADILSSYDMILPKRNRAKPSIYGNYVNSHIKEDMDICLDIITEMPEYAEDCEKAMNSDRETVCNMFVMPKPLMDEYCQWLFTVLFAAEKKIDVTGRDDYEKRVFGFLSERLFNVWLYHKNPKIYYAPIYDLNVYPLKNKAKGLMRRIKGVFGRR